MLLVIYPSKLFVDKSLVFNLLLIRKMINCLRSLQQQSIQPEFLLVFHFPLIFWARKLDGEMLPDILFVGIYSVFHKCKISLYHASGVGSFMLFPVSMICQLVQLSAFWSTVILEFMEQLVFISGSLFS